MRHQAEQVIRFTETYQKYQDAPIAVREAMALKAQFPYVLSPIEDEDLFAGRINRGLVGFSHDEWGQQAFGYYTLPEEIDTLIHDPQLADLKDQLQAAQEFWRTENTSAKLRAAYPPEMVKALPSDNWMGSSGVSFPLYRLTGGNINYSKLMKLGIPGLLKEVREQKGRAAERGRDVSFYTGLEIALEVFIDSALFFSQQAAQLINETDDKRRQADLAEMSRILKKITQSAPETLREALQLFWLYAIISDVRNHGRMDVYLGDFYVNDLAAGRLDKGEALRLLQSIWRLMVVRNTTVHNRVIIGGLGRPNESNADEFALLAMEASRTVKEVEPQLTLRFYRGMDPRLMEKAKETIGEGTTYPMLYNDDVNVPAVQKTHRVSYEDALQYIPFGCGEYIIDYKGFGTPSGVINLLKALEITLRNGRDPISGRIAGLQLGEFRNFATFEDLWEAYTKQVEYFVRTMADQQVLEYEIAGREFSCLYMSLLYDDCLEKGVGMFSGGVKYLGGTLETYGNVNTADSLTVIKNLVYDKEVLDPDALLEILDADFEGFEAERHAFLELPKYGNDDPEADAMVVRVHEHICSSVWKQTERVGLQWYLVVVINNSANTLMGRWTAASADGRKSRQPMANANNPSGGNDRNGVTAFLNSLVKLDPTIHAGAVQNMKFSKSMFREHRDKLDALLDVYFDNGGAQAMITVVSRQELEEAMREPEKHQNLIVRVGGFSARFVTLDKDVQLEIISRTLY